MRLRDFIYQLISFGGYSRKLYRELHDSFNKDIANTREVVAQAKAAEDNYNKKPTRFSVIEAFDANSPEFQKQILELSKSATFRWLVFSTEQDVYDMMNNATGEKAVEIMGMSKGLRYFRTVIDGICKSRQEFAAKAEFQNNSGAEID